MRDLANHGWSHQANNYGDYIERFKQEDRLFARAMQLSVAGMDAFRQAREDSIMHIVDTAVRQAQANTAEIYKRRIAELRLKYMTPLDHYQEELDRHDWTYDYSDNNHTWRCAAEMERALVNKAIAAGEPFIEAFKTRYNAAFTDGRTCPWDHIVRRVKANG
jgi:hypothetical protein